MRYEEFLAIPMGSVVEFRVADDRSTWEGQLASEPYSVICEGGPEATAHCRVLHTEPIAFYCVDLQIISPDWPCEDPDSQYGTEFALVPIEDLVRVMDLPPEK